MPLKLIAGPASEPITLAEAKLHLKVDGDEDDALITALIAAARQAAEHETGRPFVTQTWELILDAFPAVEIDMGKPNVIAITSVKYIDEDGIEQTMDSSSYSLDNESVPGWLLPAIGGSWPETLDTTNALRVRFTCGYGSAAQVPEGIKSWIKLRVGTLYKHREQVVAGVSVSELPGRFADSLLDPFRVYGA